MKKENGSDLVVIVLWVFVILKLTGVIDWSWWWVLSPLIFSAFVAGIIVFIKGGVVLIKEIKFILNN